MRYSSSEFPINNNMFGKGRAYSNRDKNSWNNYMGGEKKDKNDLVSRPMFINSKLENNGNPEGNFVKINIASEEKNNFKLTNIGEVSVNCAHDVNSIVTMKTNLLEKESEKKENSINKINSENINENKISIDYNKDDNNSSSSLPWRSGSFFGERGGGGYKKDYHNKNYRNYKNNYYYSNGKNYNKNKYQLNQPQSKKMNKFD